MTFPQSKSTRTASRILLASTFALVLALAPVLTACGKSSDSKDANSSSTTLPDAKTRKLSDVTIKGDFGSKPEVRFDAAFIGDSEESAVIISGTGPEIKDGQRIETDYVAISGNDGADLDTTYGAAKTNIVLDKTTLLAAVYDAIVGKNVGSRIALTANMIEQSGMWVIFVFDITGAIDIPTSASGTPVTPPAGLPTVIVENGVPTIQLPVGAAPTTQVTQVLIKGNGPEITAGQTITMQYTGMIWSTGKVFDSSWGSAPVDFPIGQGSVIAGFDSGLVGQTVGSRVLLIIPPDQGYGAEGNAQAGISGTDTLVFIVDLLLVS